MSPIALAPGLRVLDVSTRIGIRVIVVSPSIQVIGITTRYSKASVPANHQFHVASAERNGPSPVLSTSLITILSFRKHDLPSYFRRRPHILGPGAQ